MMRGTACLNRIGDCALSLLHSDRGAGLIVDQRGNQLVHRIGIEIGVIETGPLGRQQLSALPVQTSLRASPCSNVSGWSGSRRERAPGLHHRIEIWIIDTVSSSFFRCAAVTVGSRQLGVCIAGDNAVNFGAAIVQLAGELKQSRAARLPWRQHQHRIAGVNQCHRPCPPSAEENASAWMPHLLEFERHLAGDGKACASPDHVEPVNRSDGPADQSTSNAHAKSAATSAWRPQHVVAHPPGVKTQPGPPPVAR